MEARKLFAEEIGDELRDEIEFFEAGHYNRSSSIQDNILFGKIALDKANAIEEVNHLVAEIIDQENLRPVIINAGLNSQAGLADPGFRKVSDRSYQLLVLCFVVRTI